FLAPSDRPPLPSFPPRRSSDLSARLVAVDPGRGRDLRHDGLHEVRGVRALVAERLIDEAVAVVVDAVALLGAAAGQGGAVGLRRDRKSTPLNSSHEWISYAVFC